MKEEITGGGTAQDLMSHEEEDDRAQLEEGQSGIGGEEVGDGEALGGGR